MNKPYPHDPLSWLGTIKKEIQPSIIDEKADPDEVIAEIKEHWDAWFNQFLPGLFESRAFRNAISAMPKDSCADDRGNACNEAQALADTLLEIKKRNQSLGAIGHYDIDRSEQSAHWEVQRNKLHYHLSKALEIFEGGQLSQCEIDDDPREEYRPKHHLDIKALNEWAEVTGMISTVALFTRCINPAMHSRSFTIKQAKGGHTIESRGLAAVVRAVLYRVPEGTKNRFATEPIAKLVSGDQLPHVGLFPSWNFDPWSHHASHSIPKTDSTWDCCSSTQSFAISSTVRDLLAIADIEVTSKQVRDIETQR